MKYMVMECHPGFAVVMSEDGRFLKVANLNYQVGQMVTHVVEMQVPTPEKKRKRALPLLYSAATVAACAMLAVTVFLYQGQVAYASVYLDINPQVRIGVNRQDKVVELEAGDADGSILLEGYQYKQKSRDQVVQELVERAIALHYLKSGDSITLRVDAKDADWAAQYGEDVRAELDDYLAERLDVLVDLDDWDDLLDEDNSDDLDEDTGDDVDEDPDDALEDDTEKSDDADDADEDDESEDLSEEDDGGNESEDDQEDDSDEDEDDTDE